MALPIRDDAVGHESSRWVWTFEMKAREVSHKVAVTRAPFAMSHFIHYCLQPQRERSSAWKGRA